MHHFVSLCQCACMNLALEKLAARLWQPKSPTACCNSGPKLATSAPSKGSWWLQWYDQAGYMRHQQSARATQQTASQTQDTRAWAPATAGSAPTQCCGLLPKHEDLKWGRSHLSLRSLSLVVLVAQSPDHNLCNKARSATLSCVICGPRYAYLTPSIISINGACRCL